MQSFGRNAWSGSEQAEQPIGTGWRPVAIVAGAAEASTWAVPSTYRPVKPPAGKQGPPDQQQLDDDRDDDRCLHHGSVTSIPSAAEIRHAPLCIGRPQARQPAVFGIIGRRKPIFNHLSEIICYAKCYHTARDLPRTCVAPNIDNHEMQ